MAAPTPAKITPAEYLEFDRNSEIRHEYIDGRMVAMSGGTGVHSILSTELARHVGNALEGRPCAVTTSDLKLEAVPGEAYFYPDVMVTCGSLQYVSGHTDMITNPVVIVEVLSGSTERWDRTHKFQKYRRIPTLRDYVLVSQSEMLVEWYTRHENGDWVYHSAIGPEGLCRLASLSIEIPLAAIYAKTALA